MPNPEQMLAVAAVAESAAREALPVLSEKIALSLPEIFGPAGKHTAEAFAAAPRDASALEGLAARFQQKLSDFGLHPSATPSDLFDAARSRGVPYEPSASRSPGTTAGPRRGHYAGSLDLVLDDGSRLSQSFGGGRSGYTKTTVFGMPDKSASLFEGKSNFFHTPKHTIGFRTEHISLEEAIAR